MIDDTGLLEFNGWSRARRQVFTLAAVSLAAACVETLPADDAVVAELSSGQVLALCDELRDAVQRDDQLILRFEAIAQHRHAVGSTSSTSGMRDRMSRGDS